MRKPRRAAILARISDDRHGDAAGVTRQIADARKLAAQLGWQVGATYTENDTSAYRRRRVALPDGTVGLRVLRPQFRQLLADLTDGVVDGLVAYDLDRVARDPRDLEDLIDVIEQHHLPNRAVTGSLDLSTTAGITMARILVAIANQSSRDTSRRVIRAAEDAAAAGRPAGGLRPFGWNQDRVTLDPSEHAIIVEVADRLLSGESLRGVAAELNLRGVPTVTGTPWSPGVLKAMLARPRMIGHRVHRGAVAAKAAWEPALPEGTWRELRALLTDPARRTGSNARRYLLTGVAECGPCERPISIRVGTATRSAGSRVAYRCPGCGLSRAQPAVDAYVVGAVLRRLEDLPEQPLPDVDAHTAQRITALQDRLALVTREFADDPDVTPDQLRAISRDLRSRLAELERQGMPSRQRRLITGAQHVGLTEWESWPLQRRRAIIGELIQVRVLPARRSAPRRFDPSTVELSWR